MSKELEYPTYTRLGNGRYVPAQPLPFYNWKTALRSLLCKVGHHKPGAESEGWFCEICNKQMRQA